MFSKSIFLFASNKNNLLKIQNLKQLFGPMLIQYRQIDYICLTDVTFCPQKRDERTRIDRYELFHHVYELFHHDTSYFITIRVISSRQ